MGLFPVERQLILNRLGKTSLNSDTVELIKGFAFESWQNWCIRVEAERMKRLTNKCVKMMEIWRTLDNQQWVCSFCLLYTSPSPRDGTSSRMPSSA